ncbi:MAG TPA: enoyl-CoA hydratase/isomerase family protein [Bacteroidales bacterium]|nr:enoyl-CoA hydratase/isomerase family protein [Bacteroidales bacterium]
MVKYQTINWRFEDHIGFIELNSPPANSMNKLFFYEIHELSDMAFHDERLKALIISGTGRHFSSGADIRDLLSFDGENTHQARDFYIANSRTFKRFYMAGIPVIAAIKGVCLGSAMELAMSCHFRIAAENIIMGFPEAGYNLMTGCGGSVYLSDYTDKKTAIELMLTGKNLNAQDARQTGLVDKIVRRKEVMAKAVDFAEKIYKNYNPKLRNYYIGKYM